MHRSMVPVLRVALAVAAICFLVAPAALARPVAPLPTGSAMPGERSASKAAPAGPAAPATGQAQISEFSVAIQDAVERVLPSVVQVLTSGYAPLPAGDRSGNLLSRTQGGGAGVIVDPDGYIVTNAHVVEGARRVQVRLPRATSGIERGSSILERSGDLVGASVVGIDRETDLAVLKIQRSGLPALELADSDEVRTGMVVLAFGSPFGLENSVSMGVVSAPARQLQAEAPMIYIQTDATINPGNSGGPLVDTAGRVVGINTLILSQTGGSDGIGFAAPSNIVQFVYEQIRTNFRVRRGVIGANVQTITPALAHGLGLPREWGVMVSDVLPGSPAQEAGLMIGDVVLALDDRPMENGRQLEVNLYGKPIGGEVTLDIARGADTIRRRVTVVERPNAGQEFIDLTSPERNLVPELGLLCITVDERVAAMLGRLRANAGVLVAAKEHTVGPGAEFQPGDVIHMVNRTPVTTLEQLKAELAKYRPLDAVVIQIERRGQLQFIAFEME
jgi:serine protease Do